MLADAEPRGVGVSPIQHLVEPDRAGGGLVDRERIKTPPPAPIGARHRIARALHLRQRGQQLGRDRGGGVSAEQRPVLPPRLGGLLVEPVADEGEELGGLADDLVEEVGEGEGGKEDYDGEGDAKRSRRSCKLPPYPPGVKSPAAKARKEGFGFWHVSWK